MFKGFRAHVAPSCACTECDLTGLASWPEPLIRGHARFQNSLDHKTLQAVSLCADNIQTTFLPSYPLKKTPKQGPLE